MQTDRKVTQPYMGCGPGWGQTQGTQVTGHSPGCPVVALVRTAPIVASSIIKQRRRTFWSVAVKMVENKTQLLTSSPSKVMGPYS